jgi:hypothetical protein
MIRIDLLPPELRGKQSSTPGMMIGLMGFGVFFGLAAFGVAWGWFGVVGEARGDVQIARDNLEMRKPRVEYSDRLEAEKKEYTGRLDHIKQFSSSRVLWTKKIDQFWSLIDTPSEAGRYSVWFEKLTMDMAGSRAPALVLKGSSETDKFRKLSDFHGDLQAHAFFTDFESISNPTFDVKVDDEFEPTASCEFELTLALKDRSGGKDAKKKTAKKPAAPAKQ